MYCQEMTSYLINFYLFSFLPTDPTSFPWCSVEQGINLAWPEGREISGGLEVTGEKGETDHHEWMEKKGGLKGSESKAIPI